MKRMPSRSAAACKSPSACAVIMVPVGLAGLATSTPLSGARRCAATSVSGVIAKRVAAERLEDVPVGRIARDRDRHPVAGLEQRQECKDESRRGASRNDDPRRIDRHAIALVIVSPDARAQRWDAE